MAGTAAIQQRRREAALLLAATVLAYAFSFAGAFHFDDHAAILGDPAARSLAGWWQSLPSLRPLLKLSYALNHASGLGLVGFHAVNLAIHAASALLAWRLLCEWLPAAGVSGERAGRAAWLAALLFALHPAGTEAVTYLSGRSMSLMGLASLASAVLWIRSRAAWDGAALGSAACFAAALAVRETAWALLPALALLALARGDGWRRTAAGLAPQALVLACGAAAFLAWPPYRQMALATLLPEGPGAQLLRQVDAIGYLLTRPLLLLQVNIDPVLPVRAGPDAGWWLAAGGLLLLLLAAAAGWRSRPWLAAGLLWPLILLAPGYSVFLRDDPASDRHLYLALLGPAWLVAAALTTLPRRIATAGAVALGLLLGTATLLRNVDYLSEVDLWRVTVADSPRSPRAWNNYGYALQLEGRHEAARRAYLHALELDPGYFRARFNLAALERAAPAAH